MSQADRGKNFGQTRDLRVDSSPTARAYLRFDVALQSDQVQHVSLLIYSRTRSRKGYQVRLVNEYWRERRINFLNAPQLVPGFVASSGPLRAGSWKAVDVTSLVHQSAKSISFALTTASANVVDLASRETRLHGPRLVVETQQNDTTRSTTTSTQGTPGP